jgi:hypothetical protein
VIDPVAQLSLAATISSGEKPEDRFAVIEKFCAADEIVVN